VTEDPLQNLVDQMARSVQDERLLVDRWEIANTVARQLDRVDITQHPLGFYHYDLTPLVSIEDARLRLHIWSERTMRGADRFGLMHDHVWRLTSFLLTGQLTMSRTKSSAIRRADFQILAVSYSDDADRLTPMLGRVRCQEAARRSLTAGDLYHLEPKKVHETAVLSYPVATVVIAGNGVEGTPRILWNDSLDDAVMVDRVSIDESAAAEELLAVVESIERDD
jgi:hypothetical protein